MDVREKSSNGKRLIDANALISYMDECSKESRFRVYYGYAKSFIDDAPTIDAVPVVRCRECKYRFKNNGHSRDGCPIIDANIWMDDDDFCSHGKREEGAI